MRYRIKGLKWEQTPAPWDGEKGEGIFGIIVYVYCYNQKWCWYTSSRLAVAAESREAAREAANQWYIAQIQQAIEDLTANAVSAG